MRITLENKRTREQLVLSFDEIKAQFKTEFERAYQGFIRHETEKNAFLPEFMHKHLTEADFLLSLQWNFNNYSHAEWYIAAIR
ncbi:MAG: hypothetical protein MSB80_04540 [Alphaproteobacteria bacterium]|nr:hypothetical protein [Alphaproteobacteria bacterium]